MQTGPVVIAEFVCGGGWDAAESPPPSLLAEGMAMWRAVVLDVAAGGVDVITTWDDRLRPPPTLPASVSIEVVRGSRAGWLAALKRLARQAESVFVIAPETDGILQWVAREFQRRPGRSRCSPGDPAAEADRSGRARWIGAAPGVIAVTGDKFLAARWLKSRGVTTPRTWLLAEVLAEGVDGGTTPTGRWLLKRRDGAGCVPNRLFAASATQLRQVLAREAPPEALKDASRWIVQPFIAGASLSIGVVFTGSVDSNGLRQGRQMAGRHWATLPPMRQMLRETCDTLTYEGSQTARGLSRGVQRTLADRAAMVAARLARRITGYLGIDMILDPEGEVWVVDVNPRLCTSYLCYREMFGPQLVRAMLQGVGLQSGGRQEHPVRQVVYRVGEAKARIQSDPERGIEGPEEEADASTAHHGPA